MNTKLIMIALMLCFALVNITSVQGAPVPVVPARVPADAPVKVTLSGSGTYGAETGVLSIVAEYSNIVTVPVNVKLDTTLALDASILDEIFLTPTPVFSATFTPTDTTTSSVDVSLSESLPKIPLSSFSSSSSSFGFSLTVLNSDLTVTVFSLTVLNDLNLEDDFTFDDDDGNKVDYVLTTNKVAFLTFPTKALYDQLKQLMTAAELDDVLAAAIFMDGKIGGLHQTIQHLTNMLENYNKLKDVNFKTTGTAVSTYSGDLLDDFQTAMGTILGAADTMAIETANAVVDTAENIGNGRSLRQV